MIMRFAFVTIISAVACTVVSGLDRFPVQEVAGEVHCVDCSKMQLTLDVATSIYVQKRVRIA